MVRRIEGLDRQQSRQSSASPEPVPKAIVRPMPHKKDRELVHVCFALRALHSEKTNESPSHGTPQSRAARIHPYSGFVGPYQLATGQSRTLLLWHFCNIKIKKFNLLSMSLEYFL